MKPQFKAAQVEVTDEGEREITIVASDESVDRYGDIIRVSGWDLSNYAKNPVLLFGHNSSQPPIGNAKVYKEGKKLMAKAKFLPEGVWDFADTVWRIVKAGALRASSVGFMPTVEPNVIRDEKNDRVTGYEYVGQELLELSIVPVPANPQALAISRSLNLSSEAIKRVFQEPIGASAFLLQRRREIDLLRLRVRSD